MIEYPQGKSLASNAILRVAAATTVFLVFLWYLLLHDVAVQHQHQHQDPAPTSPQTIIPNIVHFVYILPDDARNFKFEFSHFLSLFAASHHFRPDTILLHTNVPHSGPEILRARNGTAGKWSSLIFSRTLFPTLQINTVPLPTHANNGKSLANMEHKSDFVRVQAVHDHGGVYIDWDVHALRDMRALRESGFKAVAGRQLHGQINSGTFLSVKQGRMISLWREQMHEVYDGGWTTHSNEVVTRVGERLVREPPGDEILILERDAFAPGSWEAKDEEWLFRVHNDTGSNLVTESYGQDGQGKGQGKEEEVPVHGGFDEGEAFEERWEHPERFPKWEHDWSGTYLLHAFSPFRFGGDIYGFKQITPRYVLERRSNFARAVYPVAKLMYDRGLISVNDTHTGL